jgi:hypothetical protein
MVVTKYTENPLTTLCHIMEFLYPYETGAHCDLVEHHTILSSAVLNLVT